MSRAEAAAFEAEPYYRDAICLRQWDDQGKVARLVTPGLAHYAGIIGKLSLQAPS